MKISVCVGSSCHIKGSYDVIAELTGYLKKYDVEDEVELVASFCLGKCPEGVVIKTDEYFLKHVDKANLEEKFLNDILPLVGKLPE
ncbi:MAG: (2Fe-2S) ferredoxin domain-containing protein [Clostridiales bacterium]|jgi:NADH:ubiquinone oxidoreductase subunit E|nr:(2Fe-2S) ferredoxin domain-containing protein [Clostridiales bacterium]